MLEQLLRKGKFAPHAQLQAHEFFQAPGFPIFPVNIRRTRLSNRWLPDLALVA